VLMVFILAGSVTVQIRRLDVMRKVFENYAPSQVLRNTQ